VLDRVIFPTSVHRAFYHECETPLVDPLHSLPLKIVSQKHRRQALDPPHVSAHECRRQHARSLPHSKHPSPGSPTPVTGP